MSVDDLSVCTPKTRKFRFFADFREFHECFSVFDIFNSFSESRSLPMDPDYAIQINNCLKDWICKGDLRLSFIEAEWPVSDFPDISKTLKKLNNSEAAKPLQKTEAWSLLGPLLLQWSRLRLGHVLAAQAFAVSVDFSPRFVTVTVYPEYDDSVSFVIFVNSSLKISVQPLSGNVLLMVDFLDFFSNSTLYKSRLIATQALRNRIRFHDKTNTSFVEESAYVKFAARQLTSEASTPEDYKTWMQGLALCSERFDGARAIDENKTLVPLLTAAVVRETKRKDCNAWRFALTTIRNVLSKRVFPNLEQHVCSDKIVAWLISANETGKKEKLSLIPEFVALVQFVLTQTKRKSI